MLLGTTAVFSQANTAPTFTSTPVTSVGVNNLYSYRITTNDVDGDAVTVTATTTLPTWLTLSSTTTVSTLAGSTQGFADGTGTAAKFYQPAGVAVDGSGNFYVADLSRIRKISPTGVVTTLAGSGVVGFADGTGTAAKFYYPQGVAVDGLGNVYVADKNNHRIRKISPTGVVTTFAGGGVAGSADGTGTDARFYRPSGVAIDGSGNFYVADTYNHKIRKISPTGVVTTFAGSGTRGFADGTGTAARFNYPRGVAVDGSGNVYVGDEFNQKIRKISPTGVVTTLAGSTRGFADGTGTAAKFYYPSGVAVDVSGNVYVADYYNNRIRKISPTGVVTTLAGSSSGFADGSGTVAKFNRSVGIAVDGSGNVYVADSYNDRIRKISLPGVLTGTPTAAAIGSHKVVLQASDGKGGTVEQRFTITVSADTLGLEDIVITSNQIILYPIPSTGVLYFKKGSSINIETINLYNIQGNLIKNYTLFNKSLDISNLSNGIYLMKIKTNKNTYIRKIIKK